MVERVATRAQRRRGRRQPWVWRVLAASAVVATLVLGVALFQPGVFAQLASRVSPPGSSESATPLAGTTSENELGVAAVQRRVLDPSTRVISVLCDSVGNDPGEWVSQWAKLISAHRTVTVHNYAYTKQGTTTVGAGWSPKTEVFTTSSASPTPPLTLWNFGWPGGAPLTVSARMAEAFPQAPDVIVYSYGHNLSPVNTTSHYTTLIPTLQARFPGAAAVASLAHMSLTPRPEQAVARVRLAAVLRTFKVPIIDLRRTLFTRDVEQGKAWFKDNVHPHREGYVRLGQRFHDALTAPATALYGVPGIGSVQYDAAAGRLTLRDARGQVQPYAVATIYRPGKVETVESDADGFIPFTPTPSERTRVTVTDGVVTGSARV